MRGFRRLNSKGFSFVEVLCAVAILTLISGVISTIVVVSTRTYKSSVSETTVQQEAQLAANNIGNIIKDACKIVYRYDGKSESESGELNSSEVGIFENGERTNENYSGNTTLSVITNDNKQYDIIHVDDKLVYEESTVSVDETEGETGDETPQVMTLSTRTLSAETGTDTTSGKKQLLASNISKFKVDTTSFKDTRTVSVELTVYDEATGKEIPMTYSMTSRNEVVENIKYNEISADAQITFLEDMVCLVAGEESYKIPIAVTGNVTNGVELVSSETTEGLDVTYVGTDYIEVQIPVLTDDSKSYNSEYKLTIATKDKENGVPKATASTTVYCRYVKDVKIATPLVNTSNADGNSKEGKGAVYTFYADVTGENLTKYIGRTWDINYKKAQAVYWSYELTADGKKYNYTSTADGVKYSGDGSQVDAEKYIKVESSNEDVDRPNIKISLTQDMPEDFSLTVTALSKHGQGINKGESTYDTKGELTDEVTIKPEEIKTNTAYSITLEPNETGTVKLSGIIGAAANNVTLDYKSSCSDPDNTKAEYSSSTKTVTITLGKNEKGTNNSYKFEIKVLVSGVQVNTITVYVSRIDAISIYVKDSLTDKGSNTMDTPTYDFRARYNVSSASSDTTEMQANIANIFTNRLTTEYQNADDTQKQKILNDIANAFATEISWELRDANGNIMKNNGVECSGTCITTAGINVSNGDTQISKASSKTSYTKDFYWFSIESLKAPEVTLVDGVLKLKQVAEIDIATKYKKENSNDSNSNKTATGLPDGSVLTVTMRALNPDGSGYSESNVSYNENGVVATASVKGSIRITYPADDYVIVERGQGTDSKQAAQEGEADSELVIPLTTEGGAAYKLSAVIEGNNPELGTRLSVYDSSSNPYVDSSNTRLWWLGLVIDPDETGVDGKLSVKVTAYSGANQEIGTLTIPLVIREVSSMDLKVVTDSQSNKWTTSNTFTSTLNKANETITLAAYPHGYGDNNGTQYYAMQTQSSSASLACRWETKGHGEYKSPYAMKWTMTIGNETKELSKWVGEDNYIAADSIKTSVDTTKGASTITFKLNKALPNGTVIKATSLHAQGENKSGKKYGDVSAELKVSSSSGELEGGGKFIRGATNTFVSNIWEGSEANYMSGTKTVVFRYKEVEDTEWSQYYLLKTFDKNNITFYNNPYNILFLPDKDYYIEFVKLIIQNYDENNPQNMTLVWPYNSELRKALNLKQGWAEGVTETKTDDFMYSFYIDKIGVTLFDDFGSDSEDGYITLSNTEGINLRFELSGIVNWSSNYFMKIEAKTERNAIDSNGEYVAGVSGIRVGSSYSSLGDKFALLLPSNPYGNIPKGKYCITIAYISDPSFKFKKIVGTTFNWTTEDIDIEPFVVATAYIEAK